MKTLWLKIYTDDDAEIKYKGNSYCWYSDDLRICKHFETSEDIIKFIQTEIEVVEGYKATELVKLFLKECCELIEDDGEADYSYSGNQEIDFSVYETIEDKSLTEPDYFI
jgi:hypothetical protein